MYQKSGLNCKISLQGQKNRCWEKSLPRVPRAQLAELFIHHFGEKFSAQEKRQLGLNLRKTLWNYEHISERVWQNHAYEFGRWLQDSQSFRLEAFEGGVALIFFMLKHHPELLLGCHIKLHNAPVIWLAKQFQYTPISQIDLEQVLDPTCPWSQFNPPWHRAA